MYKVFYNERIVFFTKYAPEINDGIKSKVLDFKKIDLPKIIQEFLIDEKIENLYIVHDDPEYAFYELKKLYIFIEAAGGLVKNNKNELLFIYRRDKWDLPKGKIEDGENPETCALREVEEECGVQNLKITKPLINTFHTYQLNDEDYLKKTYWFEMIHEGNELPKPQTEEEITQTEWLTEKDFQEIFKNTFPSIVDVIKSAGLI